MNKPNKAAPNPLLSNPDVQAMMKVLEGLIKGTKKLVIESVPSEMVLDPGSITTEPRFAIGYTHTFKVEDTDATGSGTV